MHNITQLEDAVTNANKVGNQVLDKLLVDNIISQEHYDEYSEKFGVILIKPITVVKWFKKFVGETGDIYRFKFIRLED